MGNLMKTLIRSIVLASAVMAAATAPSIAQEIKVGLALPQNATGFDFVNGMYETFKAEVEANSDMTVDLVYAGALGAWHPGIAPQGGSAHILAWLLVAIGEMRGRPGAE